MKLFRSKAERELDGIIGELNQYLSNNYKDLAHSMREKLHLRATELHDGGKLSDKLYKKYETIYDGYTQKMKNYNHREFYRS